MNYFQCPRVVFAALVCLPQSQLSVAQQPSPGVPAFKVAAPNGQESILLGDLHVGIPGLSQPDASVFDKARVFVTEHPPGNPAPARLKAGDQVAPWAQALTAAERKAYYSRAECLGPNGKARAEEALTYKSAQTANQIAYQVCDQKGAAPPSRQWLLGLYAHSVGLPLGFLEQAGWVEAQRHLVPDEVSDVSLRWILQRDPRTVLSEVVEAMNVGDYERIAIASRNSMGGAKTADRFIDIMLTQRNKHWLPGLRKFLDEGRAVVLVGAGHLPGQNGLVELLRADGYTVTPIRLPALPQ